MTGSGRRWTLLSSHGQVLLAVAGNPEARIEDLVRRVELSRRSVLAILHDLEEEGYLQRVHVGRRTTYRLARSRPMRHPASAHHEVGELIALLADPWQAPAAASDDRQHRATVGYQDEKQVAVPAVTSGPETDDHHAVASARAVPP